MKIRSQVVMLHMKQMTLKFNRSEEWRSKKYYLQTYLNWNYTKKHF